MAVIPAWRRRLVFVTSTFRDMRAEREYLRTCVFPELQERLRPRHHHLEPVDLRWGVESASADEERCKELATLKVCLGEINRSRPLQIVLIGDRYGWVPPEQRAQAVVREVGFQTEVVGKSVAALEIEFGLSGDPEQPQRCFFYFREPLDYDRMPEDVAADYRGTRDAELLAELKQRIQREMPDRVRRYQAHWDEQNQVVTGLDDWGRMVLDDLWQALDDETQAYVALPPPTWQDEQRWLLGHFVQTRGEGFVGRAAILDRLLRLARSPADQGQTWGACVTGGGGAGKSALLAHLHRQLQQEDVLLLTHAAGIGARSIQVDSMLRRWVPELAQAANVDAPVDDSCTSRPLQRVFVELLARVSAERRVVLLVDGLNQFEATGRAQHLTWLPQDWPAGARLIATTVPGRASEALEGRPGVEAVPLPLLDADEARQIAEAVCRRYHRQLDPEAWDILVSKRLPEGTPAFGNPLWLELALEELNLLDGDDRADPLSDVGRMSGEQLRQLALDAARDLPPDVEALYAWVLERNERLFGAGWVRGLVNLVGVSRNGLRESDLQVLLPKVARLLAPSAPREPWDGLKFPLLRRAFRAHLAQCGTDGGWDLCHSRMRDTIRQRNLREPQLVQQLHASIAYHLKSLPSSDRLRQTELMAHLIGSEDRLRAAHYYSGELPEAELAGATQALADHILAGSNQTPNAGLAWAVSLLIEPKLAKWQVAALCRRYNTDLLKVLENNAPVDARKRIADATRKAADELVEHEPDNAQWQQCLAASYQKLATLNEEAGNHQESTGCWRRCHEALRALRDAHAPLDPPLAELLEDLERRL